MNQDTPTQKATSKICSKTVADQSGFHFHNCRKPVTVELNGKFYCKVHDPKTQSARDLIRNEKYQASMNASKRQFECFQACSDMKSPKDEIAALCAVADEAKKIAGVTGACLTDAEFARWKNENHGKLLNALANLAAIRKS